MPPERPLALVTGASGSIGPAVVRRALADGFDVRVLSRRAAPPAVLPADAEARVGDIRDPAVLLAAVEGVDCVFHLAAALHVTDPREQTRVSYREVNADATETLVSVAASAGVRRLVLFSSIAVYGSRARTGTDEDSPIAPDSPYATSKALAEESVSRSRSASGSPLGVILRLAAVYGPRVKGNYRTLLHRLAERRILPILPGGNQRTLVFVDDVADAALLTARHPRAAGRIFNVTDGSTHSVREIVASMCRALGRPAPRVGLPLGPVLAAAAVTRPLLLGPFGDLAAKVEKFGEVTSVDGSRIRRELGFAPRVSMDRGWQLTVDALRASGELPVT
jgi:nucleoside-diphosphate-sugar epimerase